MGEAPPAVVSSTALLTGAAAPPLVRTWSRRAVSISLYLTVALLLLGTFPLLAVVVGVIDALRRVRFAGLRTLAFFTLYFWCELLGIAAAFVIWLATGLRRSSRSRFLELNFRLQCWWARTLRTGAFRLFSMKQEVTGAEHASGGPMILFVRHCSVADTMLPVMLVTDPHRIVLRWVMKAELLWDPCLDIVGQRLRNCFVTRTPEQGAEDARAVGQLMDNLGDSDGVALYPEGTRFTAAKRARVIAKRHASGDTLSLMRACALEQVLPPRLGGALALLAKNVANNTGSDAVFCAHTGLEGAATFWDLWAGRLIGCTVRVALWRIPFAEIPTQAADQASWLYDNWQRVDAFVRANGDGGGTLDGDRPACQTSQSSAA
jgi:1-acyl-sn-glycerol-3-phosphate acyltransferase